jgi:hypothetical protein
MIYNTLDLALTRERIAHLEQLLETVRKTARPEKWHALSSGYRLEIERMQREIRMPAHCPPPKVARRSWW